MIGSATTPRLVRVGTADDPPIDVRRAKCVIEAKTISHSSATTIPGIFSRGRVPAPPEVDKPLLRDSIQIFCADETRALRIFVERIGSGVEIAHEQDLGIRSHRLDDSLPIGGLGLTVGDVNAAQLQPVQLCNPQAPLIWKIAYQRPFLKKVCTAREQDRVFFERDSRWMARVVACVFQSFDDEVAVSVRAEFRNDEHIRIERQQHIDDCAPTLYRTAV